MNKSEAYKFFNSLVETYPNDAAPMLIDIIVNYFLFDSLVDNVYQMIDSDRKLEAILYVRNNLQCGLKEAKDYVDNIDNIDKETIAFNSIVRAERILKKISVDYSC
jgi:hypothetical protein